MTDYMIFLLGLASGLIIGVLGGYVVEHFRFRNELRIERMKRLTPHLELVHPTLENLRDDTTYLRKLRLRDAQTEFDSLMNKVCQGVDNYRIWYLEFQSNGFKPELAHTNKSLYALANGLFVHSQMSEKHGEAYISNNFSEISNTIGQCLAELEGFLTS